MTVDKLLEVHDDGDITRNELFVHLLLILTPALVGQLQARLRAKDDYLGKFEEWLDDLAAGASFYLGGHSVEIPEEALAAVALWRGQTRPVRNTRLVEHVNQWISEGTNGELGVEPGDVQPFLSTDVEQLLREAA